MGQSTLSTLDYANTWANTQFGLPNKTYVLDSQLFAEKSKCNHRVAFFRYLLPRYFTRTRGIVVEFLTRCKRFLTKTFRCTSIFSVKLLTTKARVYQYREFASLHLKLLRIRKRTTFPALVDDDNIIVFLLVDRATSFSRLRMLNNNVVTVCVYLMHTTRHCYARKQFSSSVLCVGRGFRYNMLISPKTSYIHNSVSLT